MDVCPFCKRIAAGDYQQPFTPDPDVVWFRPLNPVTPGHMLFVPVRHVEDALSDPYTTALVAEIAARWQAQRWGRAGTRDCNLITSVGPNATQTVRHYHLHLVPRREGDGLALPWSTASCNRRKQDMTAQDMLAMLLDQMYAEGKSWADLVEGPTL